MKNLKAIFPALLLILSLSVSSCTPVRVVSSEEREGINFEAYETFNFLDVSMKNDTLFNLNRPEIDMLKEAIAFQMKEKGYRLSENPDLWVNIGIMIEDKVQTRQTDFREAPIYIGQRRYHWESEEVVVNKYKEGTVTVDIIDAKKEERIWEGMAAGTITDDLEKMQKRINEAMELLFEQYPDKAGPA